MLALQIALAPAALGTPKVVEVGDAELVSALVRRDERAAQQAWRELAPMVYGVVSRALGPGAEVDDLVQEVFLRFYSRVHTLTDPHALRSFVYSIATRVIRWEFRKRWLRRILNLTPTDELPEAGYLPADPEVRDSLRRFYGVLDALSAGDRTLFVLRFVEGLTVDEVAAATEVSRSTVKRRLARVAKRVDSLLAADPVFSLRKFAEGRAGND
jgi:RNA polymerase sigma-70 factor (ECF subfamily)